MNSWKQGITELSADYTKSYVWYNRGLRLACWEDALRGRLRLWIVSSAIGRLRVAGSLAAVVF